MAGELEPASEARRLGDRLIPISPLTPIFPPVEHRAREDAQGVAWGAGVVEGTNPSFNVPNTTDPRIDALEKPIREQKSSLDQVRDLLRAERSRVKEGGK